MRKGRKSFRYTNLGFSAACFCYHRVSHIHYFLKLNWSFRKWNNVWDKTWWHLAGLWSRIHGNVLWQEIHQKRMCSPLGQKGKQMQTLNYLTIFRHTYHCCRSQRWDERIILLFQTGGENWYSGHWMFYPKECFWVEGGYKMANLSRHSASLLFC